MSLVDFSNSKLNTAKVCRVTAVLEVDTGTPDRSAGEYKKEYFYKIILSGEIINSDRFETSALATADRTSFINSIS